MRIELRRGSVSAGIKSLILKYGAIECLVVVASLAILMARFWRLNSTPYGFHSDEMSILANAVCLRHTGVDLWGHGWGLSSGGPLNAYGFVLGFPLNFNAAYVGWLYLAGDSIVAARSFEVVISLVIVGCTVGIANNFLGRRAALWALGLSAISPWTWALSRVAFLHPEFCTMHMFIGLWLLTRHIGRGDDPTTKELVGAGLLFGVGLFSPYSTIPTGLVAVLFGLYLYRKNRAWRPIGNFGVALMATYVPLQMVMSKYTSERISQMDVFKRLNTESTLLGKGVALTRITWDRLMQHLSLDFLATHGDGNFRQHSGWGGALSWPQLVLVALLPVCVYVLYKSFRRYEREIELLALSIVGALGGLLTASMAGEQTHANRSLAAAPFFILGCVTVAVVLAPTIKYLTMACLVSGVLFSGYYLHDYFVKFPARSDFFFQSDLRRGGEIVRQGGDLATYRATLPGLMQRYGILSDIGMVYYEAAGSGKGCPGYKG